MSVVRLDLSFDPLRIGRSKGWGIVEFSSANVAQRAISMLNDQELLVSLMVLSNTH